MNSSIPGLPFYLPSTHLLLLSYKEQENVLSTRSSGNRYAPLVSWDDVSLTMWEKAQAPWVIVKQILLGDFPFSSLRYASSRPCLYLTHSFLPPYTHTHTLTCTQMSLSLFHLWPYTLITSRNSELYSFIYPTINSVRLINRKVFPFQVEWLKWKMGVWMHGTV